MSERLIFGLKLNVVVVVVVVVFFANLSLKMFLRYKVTCYSISTN